MRITSTKAGAKRHYLPKIHADEAWSSISYNSQCLSLKVYGEDGRHYSVTLLDSELDKLAECIANQKAKYRRETVNGYRIVSSMPTPAASATRPGRVILVDTERQYDRYVTAWQGYNPETDKHDASWCHGHYFNVLDEARDDYAKRCERGY